MARLVQKSGYIKNGKASGYMEYVATRDGVEIIQSTESATKKQKQFIKRLLKDFPDAKALFEYSDYLQTPNRETASAFIAAALDTHLHEVESESGYMSYIAQRPRAEKHGGHGLVQRGGHHRPQGGKSRAEGSQGKGVDVHFLPAAGGRRASGIQQSCRMAESAEAGERRYCGSHAYSDG